MIVPIALNNHRCIWWIKTTQVLVVVILEGLEDQRRPAENNQRKATSPGCGMEGAKRAASHDNRSRGLDEVRWSLAELADLVASQSRALISAGRGLTMFVLFRWR